MQNLNSDVKALFCQQVDDWMLLKITEKIIQRNVFEQKKKKPGLSTNRPTNNCALYNIYYTSKTKKFFSHARSTLASVSSNYKHLRRTIAFKTNLVPRFSLSTRRDG